MNLTAINKEISPAAAAAAVAAAGAGKAITRNLLWMSWSGAVSIANSLLVWVFMARMRDVEELGRFTIVMGLYALFFGVCSLGLTPYLVSEISRRIARKNDGDSDGDGESAESGDTISGFIGSASVFLLISGVCCAALMAACGFLASESWSVRLSTLILSLAIIPTGLIGVGEATALSFGRTRFIAYVTTLENILRTIIPLGLIWLGFDISVICVSFVAVRVLALAVYLPAAGKYLSRLAFSADDFWRIFKVAPTFAGTIILASINWQAVIILLGHFSTEVESAKYGVASRFLVPVSILMASYANVIQPAIAQFTRKSSANSGLYLSRMASYPLILSTAAAILSPFLSERVLVGFFGETYAGVAPTLDILALSVVPFCLVMVVARALVATGEQHIDLLANALGVAACFAAGLLLIPEYGAKGAALAQLFSFVLMALLEIGYLSKKIVGFKVWHAASLSTLCVSLAYIILWKY
ncbi:MAG: polysaccharide biosynthesis C-terminal domain-containing protein [Acidobacteriota bacterium]|nr:polysaccharide biosynthesis C-terminal domain-containing protein [Acidobacteriota bacterium]